VNAEPKTRVLVIGLDGATFRLIKPMVAAGELPVLGGLVAGGAHGVLRSTIQPSSEQAWVTFMTGVQNGKHGIFGFVERMPGSYELRYTNGSSQKARTIWRTLSDRGRDVIVVNVPMTYPPEPVHGVLVGGLMTPSERSRFTYPATVYQELRQAVGNYRLDVDIETGTLREAGEADLLESIAEMTRLRTEAVKYLAATRDWDLLCVVYGSIDRVSHKFWKYMEKSSSGKERIVPEVYRLMDSAVGELLSSLADESTVVMIVSDHGFGPLKKAFFLNQWLREHGFLCHVEKEHAGASSLLGAGVNGMLRRGVRYLDRQWMRGAKRAAFALWPGLKGKLHSSMAQQGIDWDRTLAYGCGTMGNIYLNLRGREPAGIVEPGEEYEAIRDRLIGELRELRDAETGCPIFDAVYRREEIYSGPCLDLAPDVVGLLDPTYHVASVDWRTAPGDVVTRLGDQLLFVGGLTGQHDMEGIMIANGPGIRQGAEVEGAGIVDIAPTLLAVLDEPIPPEMDGRVLAELFAAELAAATSSPSQPVGGDEPNGEAYSEEEAAEIASRLRGLGYIND
jgi:predicted AlkP superfamily phosphohydrolase/phosphomutase